MYKIRQIIKNTSCRLGSQSLNEFRAPEPNHIYKTRSIRKKIIPSKYRFKGFILLYFLKINYKLPINRILGLLFLGLTLSRNGSPDIPRDKVSPKNKMPNILYVLFKRCGIFFFYQLNQERQHTYYILLILYSIYYIEIQLQAASQIFNYSDCICVSLFFTLYNNKITSIKSDTINNLPNLIWL